MNAINDEPVALWQRVRDFQQGFSDAFEQFLKENVDKVEVLRQALHGPDRSLALRTIPYLTLREKQELFPEWIDLARLAHSPFEIAWKVILSLPRDWVLERIEQEVDAILSQEVEDDYWMFLQLYEKLDKSLAAKLTSRAANHVDKNIRELAEDK